MFTLCPLIIRAAFVSNTQRELLELELIIHRHKRVFFLYVHTVDPFSVLTLRTSVKLISTLAGFHINADVINGRENPMTSLYEF